MSIRLPTNMEFELPQWQARDFAQYKKCSDELRVVNNRAGKNSDQFQQRCKELLTLARNGQEFSAKREIKNTLDVRAFTYLLANFVELGGSVSFDDRLFQAMVSVRAPLSRLSLLQLIHAFFKFFDKMLDDNEMGVVSQFITKQLRVHANVIGRSELATYAMYSDILFSEKGPHNVVNFSIEQGLDLDAALSRVELTSVSQSRYTEICNYFYYLETLKQIPVGEDHEILNEVCKPEVTSAVVGEGGLLGHEVLRILIDRSGNQVSKSWQRTVLTIAGDPRVPKTSDNYRKWWAFLDEKQIAQVRGWLSKLDLELFLKILEQSAKDTGKTDMTKMFKPRKRFMEGLLKQGLVSETRLFLSSWAVNYLRRNYKAFELPSFAEVTSTQTSMIYLNIGNRVHMVEGSHSFKLNLFDRLPDRINIANYAVTRFTDRQLRSDPYIFYMREFKNDEGAQQIVHDAYGNWRNKAMDYFQGMGIEVDVTKLMTTNEYRDYRKKYGY